MSVIINEFKLFEISVQKISSGDSQFLNGVSRSIVGSLKYISKEKKEKDYLYYYNGVKYSQKVYGKHWRKYGKMTNHFYREELIKKCNFNIFSRMFTLSL